MDQRSRRGKWHSYSFWSNVTYPETLAYLYAQLPMYQRIGKAAYKADLGNTHALMEVLDHPELGLRCVHVAGTNGKGSTCHMIASILQEAGYTVGLHTSPHLKDFRERFRINGEMVPEQTIIEFVAKYRDRFEPIQASFFEWGVGFALHWFRQQRVDIAVIETGMGGRLDSTNVVTPDVSVITNIGWDHMDFLGSSLPAIALEKAGIMKAGVPVIIGSADAEITNLFKKRADALGSPITFVDSDEPLPGPVGLGGTHQSQNARTALAAIKQLKGSGWIIPDAAIRRGLDRVVPNSGILGRWQVLGERPLTIADVAHNVDGIRVVNAMLDTILHERLHIVLGMVNDKDIASVLSILPKGSTYYFAKADIPRGLDASHLCKQAALHGLKGNTYPTVRSALEAARSAAAVDDMVLVTGSVFTVAEVI